MEHEEIKILVQKYFEGGSSLQEEGRLQAYFKSGHVAEELMEYQSMFKGIAELSDKQRLQSIEDNMMDLILKEDHLEKTKRRWIWRTTLSAAASIIIILGAFFLIRPQQSFQDSFDDPEIAYAYAEDVVGYMAGKYQKGVMPLSNFDKLNRASDSFNKSVDRINDGFSTINHLNKFQKLIKYN